MNTVTPSVWKVVVKTTAFLLLTASALSWTSAAKSITAMAQRAEFDQTSALQTDVLTTTRGNSTTSLPTLTTLSFAETSKIPTTSGNPSTTSGWTSAVPSLPVTTVHTTPVLSSTTVPSTIPQTTPVITPTTTPVTTPVTTPATTPVTTPVTTPATTPVTTPATTPVTTPATTPTTTPATTPETTPQPIPEQTPAPDVDRSVLLYDDVKAIWVSQFDLNTVYVVDGAQREEADFTARIGRILDNIKSQGFNTIFLQVRPNADSMAPSDYYPMSKYVVGSYGKDAIYDPIAIFVEAAHERGLSIHAWINPLRGMTSSEIVQVDPRYQIRQWYDDKSLRGKYIVLYNGNYYLNPAYEEVRQLIVNGAVELLQDYAFDGLHMDDYFYPTQSTTFDSSAYSAYKKAGGKLSLADFRREQLNLLVSALYSATKAQSSDLVYGISPAGEIERVFERQYADVYKWCAEEGYIDYICPQVYFGLEHDTLDFVSVSNIYRDIIRTDSVRLIIGMTFGKALDGYDKWAGSGKYEWSDHKDILMRSLEYTKMLEHCTGISVYCYKYFFDPLSDEPIAATEEERANFVPLLKEMTWQEVSDDIPLTEELPLTEDTEDAATN